MIFLTISFSTKKNIYLLIKTIPYGELKSNKKRMILLKKLFTITLWFIFNTSINLIVLSYCINDERLPFPMLPSVYFELLYSFYVLLIFLFYSCSPFKLVLRIHIDSDPDSIIFAIETQPLRATINLKI